METINLAPPVRMVTISADEAGQRIDNYLRTLLKGVPKSMLYRIIRKGEVRVNKKRIQSEYRLQAGDEIRVPPVRTASRSDVPISARLSKVAQLQELILYEDEWLLLLNKPAGMAVHGGSGVSFGIIEGLRALRPEARFLELVHRLDRDTSGLLLVAKKRSALRALHEQLRLHKVYKEYLALVQGEWPSRCQVVKAPLLKNILQSGERMVKVSTEGKVAETRFQIVERYGIATLIKAMPLTGRTHQIRVHTQYAQHPIAFDPRYGDKAFNSKMVETGLNRLFLHAAQLGFTHPHDGRAMRIEAPLDSMLQHCLNKLRQSKKHG